MSRLIPLVAASVLVLASCGVPITEPPTPVTPADQPGARRAFAFSVRTYTGSALVPHEVSGADCVIEGASFTAQVTSPAKVLLPDFGPATQPAMLSCTYQGETIRQVLEPYNITASEVTYDPDRGMPLVGMEHTLAGHMARRMLPQPRDKSKDEWGYRHSLVLFGQS